ncbi:hypothetical protein MSG28_010828 [Choristoneura fumiferana]|uniref:Uncharacterized protein n=1 Tax=Choristoneura fumiferana TaxID=7141 RepID=A0ACC0KPH2_CHOFU|nr:hypothetical protein MSG28_010828 [Choristoneura fumiferana]
MEDEKLIECVRKYEFLYNLQHPKYMDSVKKEMAWKEISGQLRQPATACKQRWQGLRDAYRRSLNKKKSKSGQAAKYVKKWKYEDEMSFVASYFVERKTYDSVEPPSDDDEESQNHGAATEDQNLNSDYEINSTDAVDVAVSNIPTEVEIQYEDDTIVRNTSSQPQHVEAKKAKIFKKSKFPAQSASAGLMSRFLDTQSIIPQQCEHDEIDRFFLNISETVKQFSPYQQAIAKNKIFNIVSEMELQQLAPPNFTTTSPQYAYASPASTSSGARATATPMSTSEWNIPVKDLKTEYI